MKHHLFISLVAICLCVSVANAVPNAVEITIRERVGVARTNECAVFGVPIPRDWHVSNATQFVLRNTSGEGIPAQFEILSRWGGASHNTNKYARWVLVAVPVSVAAYDKVTFALTYGAPAPAPSQVVSISTTTVNRLLVDTCVAQFIINTADFNLFEQVKVSGVDLLETLMASSAIAYQSLNGTNVVPGGTPDLTPRTVQYEIERSGPIYAVIKIKGSIMHGALAVLDYTARLHFYAGCSTVRLDFTVENNHDVLIDGMGQPLNVHSKNLANSVYISDLRLKLKLRNTGSALRILTEQGVTAENPASVVRIFQGSSGKDYWNVYTGTPGWPGEEASAYPRVQACCTNRGFIISAHGVVLTGNYAEGWMTVYRSNGPSLTACVRDFWQNYPKALEATANGELAIVLFPNGTQFQHNFRVGEQKTDSILLSFSTNAGGGTQGTALSKAFNTPLFGVVPPAWFTNATALGEVPPASTNEWPLYEHYVRTAFTTNPLYDPADDPGGLGNSTLKERAIDGYEFYGWQDYGDVPLDYEAYDEHCAGQMNLKYWFTYGMFMQFCRSGDLRWLDLALPAARHLSDIDFQHIPDEGASHWSHGAYYGHSQHDERGDINPNRNFNSPSVDLVFGVPDLLLAYYITGERRFRDVALEGLEANLNMSAFSDFTDPLPSRERANLIFACIEGFRETGDVRWLGQITNIVGHTANLSNKMWLTNPDAYGAANPGANLKLFQLSQVLWTLGKYLDLCAEYGMLDPFSTTTALRAYCDFILNYATVSVGSNASATVFEYFFDHSEESYIDHNNWALVVADALAYAYKYTGISNYLQMAARFYNTGIIDPSWSNDPPVYIDTKGLVNSINWGLVYMNRTRKMSPDPLPEPDPETAGISIRANGVENVLALIFGTAINITVSVTAGNYLGVPADWWVVAVPMGGDWWWYLNSDFVWTPFISGDLGACHPAYQGAVMNVNNFPVLSQYILPAGIYRFYFGLDQYDGILNYPSTVVSSVTITVTD